MVANRTDQASIPTGAGRPTGNGGGSELLEGGATAVETGRKGIGGGGGAGGGTATVSRAESNSGKESSSAMSNWTSTEGAGSSATVWGTRRTA